MAHSLGKIDVHHHFIPEAFAQALLSVLGPGKDGNGLPLVSWSPEATQELASEIGVATTILSMTAPGPCLLEGQKSRDLARAANEYCAKLRDKEPTRYGFFASVPSLLDSAGAIDEIVYALDVLKADGIIVFTRYGDDDCYLGDERLVPVWAELNARNAVVLIHPTSPAKRSFPHKHPLPAIEFPHETTRTALDMIMSNTKRNHPNCKVILSHAGGTLPYLADRIGLMSYLPGITSKTFEEIAEDAKSFYYDIALSCSPQTLAALFDFVPHDQILFGSDFPYAPRRGIVQMNTGWEAFDISSELRKKVNFKNAQTLFPRLHR